MANRYNGPHILLRYILLAAVLLAGRCVASATDAATETTTTETAGSLSADNVSALKTEPAPTERESLFPEASRSLAFSHFTWGAEIGASIDLGGHDMSTFDADVLLGYKNKYIRLAGIGAGIHRAFGTGNNFIPVYLVLRSSFRSKPSLFFMHLKAGYSFNTIGESPMFGDWVGSVGAGINLAMSRRFQSHIILALGFRHFNERHRTEVELDVKDVYIAQLSFGVNF